MAKPATLFRMLNANEVAKLALPPDGDAETPTTGLSDMNAQSTAEIHFPGIAPATATDADAVPDPKPIKEN